MKRMVRFTFVLGQVSLITILVFIIYSKAGNDLLGSDHSLKKMLYISGVLSIITLPLPISWLKCMHTELYVFKDD